MNKKEFQEKTERLESIRKQLKTEFFGIDEIIDEILRIVSGWYLFPELLKRPTVINLWGLTGTGKTSLVERLTTLLQYEEFFFMIDCRKKGWEAYDAGDVLSEVRDSLNGEPIILLIDEFQHERTIQKEGFSIRENSPEVDLWNVIDSGKSQVRTNYRESSQFENYLKETRDFVKAGLKIQHGVVEVTPEETQLGQQFRLSSFELNVEAGHAYFEEFQLDLIFELFPHVFKKKSDLSERIFSSNEQDLLDLLEYLNSRRRFFTTVDMSKSLIFIAGNIDEAYHLNDVDSEQDVNEIYELSKKVSVNHIKRALQERFRNEHIARLGNNHLIYPALSSKSYWQIIENEVKKITGALDAEKDLILQVHESIKQKIFDDGVLPTQGIRPLFSTISQIITSMLPQFLTIGYGFSHSMDGFSLEYREPCILAKYYVGGEYIGKHELVYQSSIDKSRTLKNTDDRYRVAIHEAGHALCSMMLLGKIPSKATAFSASASNSGYVMVKKPDITFERSHIDWIAVLLAGYSAEKFVFGSSQFSTGSIQDIEMATTEANCIVRQGHYFNQPAVYIDKFDSTMSQDSTIRKESGVIASKCEEILKEANKCADKVLKSFENQLFSLAKLLLSEKTLSQNQLQFWANQELKNQMPKEKSAKIYRQIFEKKSQKRYTPKITLNGQKLKVNGKETD